MCHEAGHMNLGAAELYIRGFSQINLAVAHLSPSEGASSMMPSPKYTISTLSRFVSDGGVHSLKRHEKRTKTPTTFLSR
jgi:bisphosphoglycerate-independent phosphoglycerate mutase (AlkP superfamily)